jgi:hypothetical protein
MSTHQVRRVRMYFECETPVTRFILIYVSSSPQNKKYDVYSTVSLSYVCLRVLCQLLEGSTDMSVLSISGSC